MPTFKRIPASVKEKGCVAIGGWAVFCKGILRASEVVTRLQRADSKGKCPIVGCLMFKGEKIYYCRYGFVDDADIYETNSTPKPFLVHVYRTDLRNHLSHESFAEKVKALGFARRQFKLAGVYKVKVWDIRLGNPVPNVENHAAMILHLV